MSLTADDLGLLADLATALGILRDGAAEPSWFGDPASHLKTVLADDGQRQALVSFLDSVLDDGVVEADDQGRAFLPLVAQPDPDLAIGVVLEPKADRVLVSLSARLRTKAVTGPTALPATDSELEVVLLQTARGTAAAPQPLVLLGEPGGRIRLSSSITIDGGAPQPGQFHLGSISVQVDVPTALSGDADPSVGLKLGALQLPGGQARDVDLSSGDLDQLEDTAVQLVLGLVQARAASAGGALGDLAALLGLGTDTPPLPVEQLAAVGLGALTTWLQGVLADTSARTAWFGHLRDLVPGSTVAPTGDAIVLTSGPAELRLGLRTEAGPSGHLRVVPSVEARLVDGDKRVEAVVDLLQVDLGGGQPIALPSLGLWANVGKAAGTADSPLLDLPEAHPVPAVVVEAVRVGLQLDAGRRPVFVLAADRVTIGAHTYPTLDLTSTDALMDAANAAVEDIVNGLLAQLGPAAQAAEVLVGLSPPPGHPEVPTTKLADLAHDPLGAVTHYWQVLLASHADAVPSLLDALRGVLADSGSLVGAILGTGTASDPWRVPMVAGFELRVYADGAVLHVSLTGVTSVDSLGARCTVVEGELGLELATIDLAGGHASLLTGLIGALRMRARGVTPPRAILDLGPTRFQADQVAVQLAWSPAGGLRFGLDAPNLAVVIDDTTVPLALPQPGVPATDDVLGAVEALVGALAPLGPDWLASTVALLGWGRDRPAASRLSLVGLLGTSADPRGAIRAWLGPMLIEAGDDALGFLADLLTAAGPGAGDGSGLLDGRGTPDEPFTLPLAPSGNGPSLVAWFPPGGAEPLLTQAPDAVATWRPGAGPLAFEVLADALAEEATVDPELADLTWNRDVEAGLEGITARWTGTDGRIVPPATPPAGVDILTLADLAAVQLPDALDLGQVLDHEPPVVVHVRVAANPDAAFPDGRPDQLVDLTPANRAPETFTAPTPAGGDWFVVLGPRDVCRLATGDADGTLGQAARLGRVLDAFASLGAGQVVVGEAGAGQAARLAAAAATAVSDVVTIAAPHGPISLTVLDEADAGDAWRLLQWLAPPPSDNEDAELTRARALIAALAEVDASSDPAAELRLPAVGIPDRAGLTVHGVFGVVSEPAVRTAITALVAAGLGSRASARAAASTDGAPPPTGVRIGLRVPLSAPPTDPLVVEGAVTVDLAGIDLGAGVAAPATDLAIRVHLRLGARRGWLAGGPDPLRGPTRPRQHGLRALVADVVVPRGNSSTATGTAQIGLLEGRVFDVAKERWDAVAGGDPVASEVRLLLSLAAGRIAAEANATVASITAVALRNALQGLQLLAGDGSVADAVEQLLHDPAALVADSLSDESRRVVLAKGAATLLGASPLGDAPAPIQVVEGPATVAFDLAARSVALHVPTGKGRFGWSADVVVPATGAPAWSVRLGSDNTASPAGAAWLDLGPDLAVLRWRPAGAAATRDVSLWPHLDAAGALDVLLGLAPALLGVAAIETLRSLDASVKPIVDAALGAFGLLDDDPAGARVRLPLGLLHDPVGWLRHGGALGSDPARLSALLDAFRPLLGLPAGPGPLPIASGVTLSAHDAGGALQLQVAVDTSGFAPPADTPLGRLVAGVDASITMPIGAGPHVGLDVHVGLAGAGAVHASLDGSTMKVFLRPGRGGDIGLFPAGPGLAAAAAQGAVDAAGHALPFLLDTLAAQSGPDLAGTIGPVVAEVGDALGLRDSTQHFTYDLLVAFAKDATASLASASSSRLVAALPTLTSKLADALPAGVTAVADGPALKVTAGPAVLHWRPNPFRFEVDLQCSGLPVIGTLTGGLGLDATGIDTLAFDIGPADIEAGPVTLQPVVAIRAGSQPDGGRRVQLGLALDGTRKVVGQWLLDQHTVGLVLLDGATAITDAGAVAAGLAEAVAALAASIALDDPHVKGLLETTVGSTTVGGLLHGVALKTDGSFDAQLFASDQLLRRVVALLDNLAGADLSMTVDGQLTIGVAKPAGVIGLSLGLTQRVALVSGDVSIWLEVDDSWIDPLPPKPGIEVGLVTFDGTTVTPAFALSVAGVGLRVGKSSGPLLDLGLTIESIALHGFASISATDRAGGVQLQLTNLAVAVSGASGGNAVASGILHDSGTASQKPKPSFSPALAIQQHQGQALDVALRAGDGDGPWFVVVQKAFGPLYLEQVGLSVSMPSHHVDSVGLVLDARVSLFGLTAAVDDLSITYFVSKGDVFSASSWEVDLGGLAISADLGALSISGGLLKNGSGDDVEYLGMLLGRFGVYGLTIYGGYGKENGVVSFFAVGAVVGPIGGVPAFFVTGIGGGFGINRALIVPTDLSQFGDYPLIKALDVAASASPDPMQELRQLGTFFPPQPGTFWFAAGLSFTSFALVDGIAVVAMQFGDGFEVSLLGLARMALPRPQVALVSIELALIVRVSSKEGVVWVQGQLTDNSWLLYQDVRLTGGFAFVVWFGGPHRGEFVLTIGGFHPDFHRDGYPVVPRLGLQWGIGDVFVIKGGAYFALTSEAIMAGIDVSVSADFGCAWAKLSFGAHAIVFFDPFHLRVQVYVRIAAGITIDTWFGDITFSVSVGATLTIEGPDFHGTASVDVGPCDVTVAFGSSDDNSTPKLSADDFIPKYLEEAAPGVAQAISSIVSDGAVPPRPGTNGTTPEPPDGSSAKPFVVTAEFKLTVTTTVPASQLDAGGSVTSHPPTRTLGIGPMGVGAVTPVLTLRWQQGGTVLAWPFTRVDVRPYGSFPVGVWGPPQSADAPQVPKGEVVQAMNQVELTARATESPGGPAIDYNRLDPMGPRRPLPFLRNSGATRTDLVSAGQQLEQLVSDAAQGADVPELADHWRRLAGASAIELASWQGERHMVAPKLGSLGDRLAPLDTNVVPVPADPIPPPSIDATVHPPVVLAMLGSGTPLEAVKVGATTTVSDRPGAVRAAPPTVAGLKNVPAAARLVQAGATSQSANGTVVPTATPATTRAARSVAAPVAARGALGRSRLDAFTTGLAPPTTTTAASTSTGASLPGATTLRAGDVAVLALPNASHDVRPDDPRPKLVVKGCPTRLVALRHGGDVLLDEIVNGAEVEVPQGTERVGLAPVGPDAVTPTFAGWQASMTLPYLGWGTALGTDATVQAEGAPLPRNGDRFRAGWVEAAQLVDGTATVTTRFRRPVDAVVVVIDDPGADDGRRLVVGLDGARQATDANGAPLPPTVVAAGNRTLLVYQVQPSDPAGAATTGVSVTVASGTGWHLVGVLGGTGAPADVAAALATRGLDAALGAAAPPGQGEVVVAWEPAPAPSPSALWASPDGPALAGPGRS